MKIYGYLHYYSFLLLFFFVFCISSCLLIITVNIYLKYLFKIIWYSLFALFRILFKSCFFYFTSSTYTCNSCIKSYRFHRDLKIDKLIKSIRTKNFFDREKCISALSYSHTSYARGYKIIFL